ncbi:unnamed protein product [Amaranthus hypochondriacus]
MAPTQTNRIETLEESVLALQASIPELQGSFEIQLNKVMQHFETTQNKFGEEYNKKLEDHTRGQNELTKAVSILMKEVKGLGVKMAEGFANQQSAQTARKEDEGNSRLSFNSLGIFDREMEEIDREENRDENHNWRNRRLEFPIYTGEAPEEWILKAERSFEFYHLAEKEKIQAAVVGLEGDALAWFRWENKRNPIISWRTLKKMMLRHFRGRRGGSLMEKWLSVKQESDVEEYEKRFIQFASNIEEEYSEEFLLTHFIRGLDIFIQVELRLMELATMEEALEWAVMIEEKLMIIGRPPYYNTHKSQNPILPPQNQTYTYHKGNAPYNPNPPSYQQNNSKNHRNQPFIPNAQKNPNTHNNPNTRRLSDKEFQDKKSRGLYYRCDEKWRIGHVCKRKELSVLIVGENETEGDTEEEYYDVEEEMEAHETPVSIFLNSGVGIDNPKTMKLVGKIEGTKVVVMIDPGATHNFYHHRWWRN